jgi:hypothetical protein
MSRHLYCESRNAFFNVQLQVQSLDEGNGKRTPESELDFFHVRNFATYRPACSESFKVGKHPSQATSCPFRQRLVNPTVDIEIDAQVDGVFWSGGFGLDFDSAQR